jgi:two-component system, chemotaxis family, protein-glutamate methylesterase/glutaminase
MRPAPSALRDGGSAPRRRPAAIGICASTGGPAVLELILRELPGDYPVPVLVVQHIAAGFVDALARLLDERVALPVAVAEAGAPASTGAWLAPDGAHLTLDRGRRLRLDADTVDGQHRPSADILFANLAVTFGPAAVAVVLTGMGRDGSRGAAAVREAGGLVLAQDETSSTIYGMPRAAAEAGARSLTPALIAATLRDLARP